MHGRTVKFDVCRQSRPMIGAARRDLMVHEGESIRLLLTVYERDGDETPLNLTGLDCRFAFGLDGRNSRAGRVLNVEGGQIYFDLRFGDAFCGDQRIAWSASIGDLAGDEVVAFGSIGVLRAHIGRREPFVPLTTPGGQGYDPGSGGVIVVPGTPENPDGPDVGPLTLLWDDGSVALWEDLSPVEYTS